MTDPRPGASVPGPRDADLGEGTETNPALLASLCVALPLAGAAWIALVPAGRRTVAAVANGSVLLAFVAALGLRGERADVVLGAWVAAGRLTVPLGWLVDPLAVTYALVVTGVGLLIHVYSVGYMAHEPDYRRYFAELNFFVGAMLLLVLADALPLLLVGWAGVGLASYLLIGFWQERPEARAAARKAFLINVVGDVAILLATVYLAVAAGRVDFAGLGDGGGHPGVALLLFLGAAAKSAQVPMHTWLPDAMEGPTPVSALIHAATMVTAGVYLLIRAHALFVPVGGVVAALGMLSAFLAATAALGQYDFKRILAYSTMSQVGYMFAAAATGAAAAATAHVVTHAFFKALLFMASGAVMHALDDQRDVRRMGGLARRLPYTHAAFLAGLLAIAGLPGFSGFWSKGAILAALREGGHPYLWAAGLVVAGLTALYMFRLYFLAFRGAYRGETPPSTDPGPAMGVPMAILALLSVFGGLLVPRGPAEWQGPLAAALGAGVAWAVYRRGPEGDAWLASPVGAVFRSAYGFDALYERLVQRPGWALAAAAARLEGWGASVGAGAGRRALDLARAAGAWHTGFVRRYAAALAAAAALLLVYGLAARGM